ncbi:MAG: DUF2007 domain-containing protein [Flavobacteriales bacterium]|nr:DUF2007 domain-containing protein [Flavobacteriales bacterium]
MITLTTCQNALQANIIKGHLEDQGIPCEVVNQDSQLLALNVLMDPYSIRILVDEKDINVAQEILKKTYPDTYPCPVCASEKTYIVDDLAGKSLSYLLFSYIFKKRKTHHKCTKCGADFYKQE